MLKEKVNVLVRKLLARNVRPIRVDEWSEFGDPCIWITESIYIQVGIDYAMIFRDRSTGLAMYETSTYIDNVLEKLKQAIDEGKP